MGKYEPLSNHLERKDADNWAASFEDIEKVLGFPLPPSARTYREWWANQRGGGHSQARGWQDVGWQVWRVDLPGEKVTFRRTRRGMTDRGASPWDTSDEALFAQASEYLGVEDRSELIREALRALIAREAGARLARLGGTMPDLKIPPRERPAI